MPGGVDYNPEKLRELMLYIAEQCESDPKFGAVKLNKILFYSDFLHYAYTGRSITGASYQRLKAGPAPHQAPVILREIDESGAGVVAPREYFGRTQDRLIPRRAAKLDAFSADEIARVDKVIRDYWPYNASEISDLSHLEMGWRIAIEKQEIPYETVFLSGEKPTPNDLEWALEAATAHGALGPA